MVTNNIASATNMILAGIVALVFVKNKKKQYPIYIYIFIVDRVIYMDIHEYEVHLVNFMWIMLKLG